MVGMVTKPRYSWGLRPGSKVCSENMVDWHAISSAGTPTTGGNCVS